MQFVTFSEVSDKERGIVIETPWCRFTGPLHVDDLELLAVQTRERCFVGRRQLFWCPESSATVFDHVIGHVGLDLALFPRILALDTHNHKDEGKIFKIV